MIRKRMAATVILGLLIVGVALPALAHSFYGDGDCDGWTLHLDGTWNAYDITVDGVSIGLEQNSAFADGSDNTSRTFVVRWWKTGPDVTRTVTVERVLDCGSETTTTLPEETTTTIPEETTTTLTETTTTVGVTTSTGLIGTFWFASSECQTLTAEWGDGISQVDVYWVDPVLGEFGPADGVVPFTESGQIIPTGVNAEFILVPVVLTGYTAVPDEIRLFTETCTPEPSTTVTTVPESSTLPFTGVSDTMIATLIFAGLVSAVLGWVFVMSGRGEE